MISFELRFHPNETHFPSPVLPSPVLAPLIPFSSPFYVYKGTTTHLGKTYTYHMYRWYYTENPGIGCCFCCSTTPSCGYHVHDFEGVTVLFDDTNNTPSLVYFHAHGGGQGMWKTWDECEKTEHGVYGRLIVYVARYSHASYPFAGTVWRIMGFGNDHTSKTGKSIAYENPVEWKNEVIPLSDGTIKNVTLKKALPSKSITPSLRFWLPFTETKIRAL